MIDTVERPKGKNSGTKGSGKSSNFAPAKGYEGASELARGWNHIERYQAVVSDEKGKAKGHPAKGHSSKSSKSSWDGGQGAYPHPAESWAGVDRTSGKARSLNEMDVQEDKLESFKVSSSSDVRTVAGAISNTARQGARGLMISACGAASINQAIKAIAIARRAYLEDDDVEIDAQVRISNTPEFKHLVHIDLRFLPSRERPLLEPHARQRVSGTSIPGKVAGAVASSLRSGEYVQVSVVGAEAMLRAVMAIAICTNYTRLDPHPISLVFWPDFDNIYADGERRTGLSLHIIPSNFHPRQ
jgi:stage V sporulation protein SpoVS